MRAASAKATKLPSPLLHALVEMDEHSRAAGLFFSQSFWLPDLKQAGLVKPTEEPRASDSQTE